jgi:hypothetical protein
MVYQELRHSGFYYCRTQVTTAVSRLKMITKREVLQHSTVMFGALLLALLLLLLLLVVVVVMIVPSCRVIGHWLQLSM